MKIYYELDLNTFEAWDGGEDLLERIKDSCKQYEFENYLEENYPDGMTAEDLNDLLRYEEDEILSVLDMEKEEETEEYVIIGSEYKVVKDSIYFNAGDIVVPLEDDAYPYCVLVGVFRAHECSIDMNDYDMSARKSIGINLLEEV